MIIKKKYITSNASRNFFQVKLLVFNLFFYKKLIINCFKNKSIDLRGRKLIYHKKKSKFKKNIICINFFKNLKKLGLIFNIIFSFKYKKFYLFINYNNFIFNYFLSNNNLLFNYFFFNNFFFKIKSKKLNLRSYLFFFKVNQKISIITLNKSFFKSNSYIISSGCFGLIKQINFIHSVIQLKLPSKELKYFNLFDFCNQNPVTFSEKKNLKWGKAGFKKKLTRKVVVRGVAKNPVDHPHGGSTKSIKFPRTPWGKATKLK